jgi:hypothetical protein
MGCCLPCFRSTEYETIEGDESGEKLINTVDSGSDDVLYNTQERDVFRNAYGEDEAVDALKQFDLDCEVFKGTLLEQKFSNKSTYDNKFAWININQRTINLSVHKNKERKHKEASLTEVENIIAGPPEKYKSVEGKENENANKCLSIKFSRGGAIDLRFKTEHERDLWFDVMNKITIQQNSLDSLEVEVTL